MRISTTARCLQAALIATAPLARAVTYDVSSTSEIASAAKTIAEGTLSYYTGDQPGGTPGLFPYPPYYWWESGSTFGHLVDYYYYTGDKSYNQITIDATCFQAGMNGQFNPANQSFDMGNDDQAFWTFTALNAMETNFPSPTSGYPEWAAMGSIVFSEQISRWNPSTCGGGLNWQVFPANPGYPYKNTAANGGLFMLAARMARYTGNQTYIDWAEKVWNWMESSVIIDSTSDPTSWRVYDGTQETTNCQIAEETQWTYNYGLLLGGLAYLYDATQDAKWLTPFNGILTGTIDMFCKKYGGVMVEVSCEPNNNCLASPNWVTFKSFTLRWMATAAQLIPDSADTIWPILEASAAGAAGQCSGNSGSTCGYHWTTTTWDGSSGLGQEMAALAAVGIPMIKLKNLAAPLTLKTGAKSSTNLKANGANPGDSNIPSWVTGPISTAEKAGAAFLTILVLVITVAGAYWLTRN